MTMPDSVWINNGDNQQTWLHSCNKQHTQRMIRADIAEGLARALELSLSGEMQNSPDTWAHAEDVLSRFRAVMSST